MTNKRVAVSGYFDPLHYGHIEYFRLAKKLAGRKGKVICILNNDRQLLNKKPKIFMPMEQRRKILEAIKYIDEIYISIDEDESVCKSLQVVRPNIFAKGGDRFIYEIPEREICELYGIRMVDKLGRKIESSSELVNKWEKK